MKGKIIMDFKSLGISENIINILKKLGIIIFIFI